MEIKAVKFRKDGFYSQPFAFGGEEGAGAARAADSPKRNSTGPEPALEAAPRTESADPDRAVWPVKQRRNLWNLQ